LFRCAQQQAAIDDAQGVLATQIFLVLPPYFLETLLVERLYEDYHRNGRRSLDRVERAVAHLDRYFGKYKASEISDEAIECYVRERLDPQGSATASVKYELALLKRMFHLTRELLRCAPISRLCG
jgi:hypothetical protein